MSFFNLRACTLVRDYVSHEHPYHQLILATSGSTELSIEGRGERITRERGCLIPSTYHHDYTGDGRNRTLVLDVPLVNLSLSPCADQVSRLFERPRFFAVPPELHRLAQEMMQQVENRPALQGEIATLILKAIYLNLHDDRLLPAPGAVRPGSQRERLDLARIEHHVDAHLGQAIHVEDLASLCALSPGHFHMCFREATGLTPQAFVQQRRLFHAEALVRHTRLPLGRIAIQVGFHDQGSFSRAYRRAFSVTPSAHRRGVI